MNECIKELALIARQFAMDQKNQYQRIHNTEMSMEDYREVYNLKFAELIVRECIDIANQESKSQKTSHGRQAADQIWNTIRNRFGVE